MNTIYLAIYFIFIIAMTVFVSKPQTKDDYLAGSRNIGTIQMALSVSATWIWAPALFVSAEQAYINGYAGLFWFLVPNVLCLLLFIPFAIRIRNRMPQGFTLSELMGKVYGKRVKQVYVFQLSALALLSTIVQLVAGGKIITLMTGIPFWFTSILLGTIALVYSIGKGIKASIFTDAIQMILILGACFVLVPMAININGFDSIKEGLKGFTNDTTLFNENGIKLLLSFGIPTTIGLIAGPFGDQNFYQRIFSVKHNRIKRSMILGATIFAIVPFMMGILGFIASSIGYVGEDQSIVNLELVTSILPSWSGIVFMFILLSGLLSTIDSNLNSASSLMNDVKKNATTKHFKLAMVILTVVSITLSNIPLTIIDFFLIYGILRSTTFMTTILTLLNVRLHEKGVFYGVLASLIVGLPIFVYGKLNNITPLIVTGSLAALLLSGIVAYTITKINGDKLA